MSIEDMRGTGEPEPGERASRRVVHQPGTFPTAGHDVVFSLAEGKAIFGHIEARLSWDISRSPQDIVVHLSAFLVDEDSKVPVGNPYYCVNHDNDRSKDGSTERAGRRQHGHVVNDETISVNLGLVNLDVQKIVFVAYIQDAQPLKHTFRDLVDGVVWFVQTAGEGAVEEDDATEVERHLLNSDYYAAETAVLIGELIRREEAWTYRNIGQGRLDMIEVGELYGVTFIAG